MATISIVLYDSEYSYYGLKTPVSFSVTIDYVPTKLKVKNETLTEEPVLIEEE